MSHWASEYPPAADTTGNTAHGRPRHSGHSMRETSGSGTPVLPSPAGNPLQRGAPVGKLPGSPAGLPARQWPACCSAVATHLFTCPWESQLHLTPTWSEAICPLAGVRLLLDVEVQP